MTVFDFDKSQPYVILNYLTTATGSKISSTFATAKLTMPVSASPNQMSD
jgi:hypothetical protein